MTNNLRHSSKKKRQEWSFTLVEQTPEQRALAAQRVQEAKDRAGLGTPEAQAEHHTKAQLLLHAWSPTRLADLFG